VQTAGNRSYTVANVQTATRENIHGGWALTIAYSNLPNPPRNLTTFSGFRSVQSTNTVDIPISGVKTPPSSVVTTMLGAVSYEGDAGSVVGQMRLGNATAALTKIADARHPVARVGGSATPNQAPWDRSRPRLGWCRTTQPRLA
jgi:hypothetical protein